MMRSINLSAAAAAALVLLAAPLSPSRVAALRSDLGRKLAATSSPSSASEAAVTAPHYEIDALREGHDEDDEAAAEGGAIVRCRICGAAVALTADYVGLHDTSKAVASKRERVLGATGELHTFVNPSRVEMELAGFKQSFGVASEVYTKKASFFDAYNWRDVRCAACKRHLGWKFHHDDLQTCINAKTIDSLEAAARVQRQRVASADEQQRRARIVAQTFTRDACVVANFGWWSYEVCYAKEVRQYHEEPDGSRSADWSMGVFVPEHAVTATTADVDVMQNFAGGQHCDENGEQRRSRVTYTCCRTKPSEVTIGAVAEPSLCSYLITVCVPELCGKSEEDAHELEGALEAQRHAEECERELEGEASSGTNRPPLAFTALRWSTVISEASSELDWARNMQFKA